MQVSEITRRVAHDLERAIARLYPEPLGEEVDACLPVPAVPEDALDVRSPGTGYVQAIDGDRLIGLAREADTSIWLLARPGDFVVG
jgi:uncharacterized membrane protein